MAQATPDEIESIVGLTTNDVEKLHEEYGYNEVVSSKESILHRLFKRFWGVTPVMLELAILLTAITGKLTEMYVILVLLVFNAILGFYQEEKANKVLAALKETIQIMARVRRNNVWGAVPGRELVLGDLVRLRLGDIVPADVRVVEGSAEVDQSVLTGESLEVPKRGGDLVFSGTTIHRGELTATVEKIGLDTRFGRTVELVQIARPKFHIEEVTTGVVRWLILMVAIFLGIGIGLAVIRGFSILDILPLGLVLLVATIPIGLPTMFAISMALGSFELAKKDVLITRLDASEDAAIMDVLCVDKTGTITKNHLVLSEAIPTEGFSKEDVILYGALASNDADRDPIDMAFLQAIQKGSIDISQYQQQTFIPFDPSTRRTSAYVHSAQTGEQIQVFKGALRSILDLCDGLTNRTDFENMLLALSRKGYRGLGVAVKKPGRDCQFVGLAALIDPPRSGSGELIQQLHELGIIVKILTGDSAPIAEEVARMVGLDGKFTNISDLKVLTSAEDRHALLEASIGFAEIYPEDKYAIVREFQQNKHYVGMTGDGVNDAPALKQAEVGITVSNATDVAKEASSVVLTSEGLGGIVDLVKTGRTIYQRILTWIFNKIVKTFLLVNFVVLAFALTGIFVISVMGMLLLLFLNDFVTLSLSTDNVQYSPTPDTWKITGIVKISVVLAVLIVLEGMGILYLGLTEFGMGSNVTRLQVFIFDFLIFSGLSTVLIVRERDHFWKSRPSRVLLTAIVVDMLGVAIFSGIGILGAPAMTPIELAIVFIYSMAAVFVVNDPIKVYLMRKWYRHPPQMSVKPPVQNELPDFFHSGRDGNSD